MSIAEAIRDARDRADISQQALADAAGVSRGFIASIEIGRKVPSIERFITIAAALNVWPGELLDASIAEL